MSASFSELVICSSMVVDMRSSPFDLILAKAGERCKYRKEVNR